MLKKPAQRFVVVSGYYPPIIGGTSTVIRNLLAAFRPESFSVVAESPSSFDGEHNAPVPAGVSVERVGVPAFVLGKIPYGARLARWLRFGLIPRIERKILAAKPEMIVAVYPSWPFLIAAYRAHLRRGVPLVTYYMDVSADASRLVWPDRAVVKSYEQNILRAASPRLVLSAAIADDFQNRFHLASIVVPHSIDLAALPAAAPPPARVAAWKDKRLIVHTGVVEGLQREGLLRLAKVIQAHPELNARLVLSTPTSHSDLYANGFDLPGVEVGTFTSVEVAALQRTADVLVAVLPFAGEIEEYQRTAFPTKVVEYMAAGVPILAHAPGDSFFAGHVRKHGYALLVDEPDEGSLHRALSHLLGDVAMRERLIRAARATVESVFDLRQVARQFAEACRIDPSALK
jgi:glycosyltransferase involved in cell wall biosynthesis